MNVTFTEGEVGEAGYSSWFVLMYHQHFIPINIWSGYKTSAETLQNKIEYHWKR